MQLNFRDIAYSDIKTKQIEKQIVELDTARRHVIAINNINTKQNTYKHKSTMKTQELIVSPVQNIALFSTEYIPKHFPNDEYIKYIFTINGNDYEVVPINSHRPGKKMIKNSELITNEYMTHYINESIKSAFLKIIITTPNDTESPMVSDIKILYGKGGSTDGNI